MKDPLDTAIDHVAARLVHMDDDEEMTRRIVSALPDRPRFGWLIPQFALISAFAVAAVIWMTREAPAPQLLPSSEFAHVVAVRDVVVAAEPRTALTTPPLARLELLEPLESASARNDSRELRRDRAGAAFGREGGPLDGDFDRSLSPIEAMRDLVMSEVAPKDLPAAETMVLAPLEIAALPLSAAPEPRY